MTCDKVFRVGSACTAAGDWCSSDGKEWLTCTAGKLSLASKCRGPGGCQRIDLGDVGGTVACDVTVGEPGDACTGAGRACTADARSVLVCAEGKLHVETTCGVGKECRVESSAACAAK